MYIPGHVRGLILSFLLLYCWGGGEGGCRSVLNHLSLKRVLRVGRKGKGARGASRFRRGFLPEVIRTHGRGQRVGFVLQSLGVSWGGGLGTKGGGLG